jgi:hypothetical protein
MARVRRGVSSGVGEGIGTGVAVGAGLAESWGGAVGVGVEDDGTSLGRLAGPQAVTTSRTAVTTHVLTPEAY